MVIPVLLGVTVIIFFITRVLASDPAPVVLGEHATAEAMAAWRADYGLDDPIWMQYVNFLVSAIQGDLGTSLLHPSAGRSRRSRALSQSNRRTCHLRHYRGFHLRRALGVFVAVKKNKFADNASMVLCALIGVSMPIFWSGILLILLFAGDPAYPAVLRSRDAAFAADRRYGLLHLRYHRERRFGGFGDVLVHPCLADGYAIAFYSMAIITRA